MALDYDVVIVGGGPAGLAAACSAREQGAERVLVIERDKEPGGILNQCIHNGFGLHYFKEELTGPEYAGRFVRRAAELGVEVMLDTMVLAVEEDHTVRAVNTRDGLLEIRAGAVVLAMGCRERTRGAIAIPGDRSAGIFTAGTAQRYINMEGWMVGRRVVILGSGDIGLIMARRMTLEGAKVLACVELMPYSNGLNRNIVQCLKDYGIPLYLSHTITNIIGRERVEQVVVSQVGPDRKPIPGTEITFDCDTVLLSVGLIPGERADPCRRHPHRHPHQRRGGLREHGNRRPRYLQLRQCGARPRFWWTSSPPRASGPARLPPGLRQARSRTPARPAWM